MPFLYAKPVFFRFIACQQALVVPGVDGASPMDMDDRFWRYLDTLANDKIIDVRISLARFIGLLRGTFIELALLISHWHLMPVSLQTARLSAAPLGLQNLVSCLAVDSSQEVRSFVPGDQSAQHNSLPAYVNKAVSKRLGNVSTFSRPPQRFLPEVVH
jgi:serine/threonine-protein phosphatase 4 regulatory subunit 1